MERGKDVGEAGGVRMIVLSSLGSVGVGGMSRGRLCAVLDSSNGEGTPSRFAGEPSS